MLFKRKAREEDEGRASASAASVAPEAPATVLRDDLGLYHLWYLEQRLREELARASRVNSVFSIATWQLRLLPGEEPSAELLRRAADYIAGKLRSYDIPARIDAQRFVAILFDADFDAASTVAFRMKGELQTRIASAGRWQAGVSTFQRDGVDADTLIQAALRRLSSDARPT